MEELTQFVEQKTITEEEHNLSERLRTAKQKHTAAFEDQQLKNSKNIIKEKIKADIKFSQYKNRFYLVLNLYKSK